MFLLLFGIPGGTMEKVHSSYYVFVPDSKMPVFPELCVVCGKAEGEALKRVQITDDLGSVQFYFYGIGRDREEEFHMHVPTHDSCGKRVRNTSLQWMGLALIVFAAIVALGIMLGWGFFTSLVVSIIIAGPLLTVLLSKPVPFELNHGGGKLHLKFSNQSYAEHVARLNDSEVIEYRQHILGNEEKVGPLAKNH